MSLSGKLNFPSFLGGASPNPSNDNKTEPRQSFPFRPSSLDQPGQSQTERTPLGAGPGSAWAGEDTPPVGQIEGQTDVYGCPTYDYSQMTGDEIQNMQRTQSCQQKECLYNLYVGPSTTTATSTNSSSAANSTTQGELNSRLESLPDELFCESLWDSEKCWPATPANQTVSLPCFTDDPTFILHNHDSKGHRFCNASGLWQSEKSDYSECLAVINKLVGNYSPISPEVVTLSAASGGSLEEVTNSHGNSTVLVALTPSPADRRTALLLVNIYFYGAIISCILLSITLFIFCYFKALQCNRITIHKNLVISFIVRGVIILITYEPFLFRRSYSYRDVDWLCKLFVSLLQYSTMANIFWMFVEGLFLHNRVAVSVFNNEAPFRIFHFVGWGVPGIMVSIWSGMMVVKNPYKCWNHHFKMAAEWIVSLPICLAFLVNAIFLVNIIRILVTKLRANRTLEADQARKAVKATLVLFPLLGLSNVLFFMDVSGSKRASAFYRISNAVLQSTQGIFVSVIYCFMNSEVQKVIMKRWQRRQARRMGANRELAYWPSKNTATTQPPMVRYEERPNHIRLEAAFDIKGRGGGGGGGGGGRTYFPPSHTMLNGNV